ncbi:RNA polymerase sigma factor (sigma-70 family) [Leifsonia sp. AK011]|uniref:sigma-70 family RNA polymerase sigma factor n=1 Tax=Leifsonia sp. AK011 TaxID=2723075 RepID=UPI0015CDCB29|nr:sigma-70 family RNA polymerase sigma factor [Leifsonia sp. AK011]NYF09418.1 RNA polymerase sigma factor (sigma-70 family) [Leifsonia sp. AK011]
MHSPQVDPRSDAELIAAVRSGDPSAFGVLYARHAPAATAMARYYSRDDFTADDLVSDAFEKTYSTLRAGGGPDVSFRAYVYTAIRRQAYELTEKGRRTQVTDDFTPFEMPEEINDPAVDTFENRMVTTAFAGLPERWQAVLWYLEVEGMRPPEVAVLLGLTANGVSALAYRAREGLRESYLQAHVSSDSRTAECEALRRKLGAYANGSLAARESAKVEKHVEECAECSAILVELRDVGHGLRVIIAPLILGGAATAGLVGGAQASPATAAALPGRGVRNGSRVSLAVGAALAIAVVAAVAVVASIALAPSEDSALEQPAAPAESSAPLSPSTAPTATPTPTPTPTPVPSAPPTRTAPPTPPPVSPPTQPTKPTPTPTPTVTPPPALPELEVAMDDLGALVLGRDGMLGGRATNVGSGEAKQLVMTFRLPAGVDLDSVRSVRSSGVDWACSQSGTDVACKAATLAAGSSSTVYIPVTVSTAADVVEVPAVEVRAHNVGPVAAAAPWPVLDRGLGTRFVADGALASTSVGASFLTCDVSLPGCAEALAREGDSTAWNNQQWNLIAEDAAGTGSVSSSTTLTMPQGADVAFAGLYWSAPEPAGDTDAAIGSLTLRSPSGDSSPITAARVDRTIVSGVDSYQAFADVTSIVAAGGAGSWAASAPRIGPGASAVPLDVVGSGVSAGWALVVVYEDSSLSAGRVAVFDGFEPVTSSDVSFVVAGLPNSQVTAGVVAWEGDAGTGGDSLSLDGVTLARSEADAPADNHFYSYAVGSAVANTFGVDVGSFLPTPLASSRATLSASTTGDQYAIGVVTVTTR